MQNKQKERKEQRSKGRKEGSRERQSHFEEIKWFSDQSKI